MCQKANGRVGDSMLFVIKFCGTTWNRSIILMKRDDLELGDLVI